MPANVTVEFELAREAYQSAGSLEAKLEALLEMKRFAPRHKGGEKLCREITRKIAQLKRDIEKKAKQSKKSSKPGMSLRKEGSGQIVLAGLPNSGKSTLLKKLTGLDVEIASYPFTTKKPEIGMMNCNGALVQVVELPAIIKGSSEGKASGTEVLSLVRNADAVVLVVRERDKNHSIRTLENEMKKAGISGKKTITVSVDSIDDIENLRETLFQLLGKVRVFTKKPGQKPDLQKPFVLPKGTKVEKASEILHKEIARHFRYARIWGSAKFPGQRVQKSYELKDGDIMEIYS